MWEIIKKIFLPRGGVGGVFVRILNFVKLGGKKNEKKH